MKIVFDSGPLISLSNTCLLDILDHIDAEYYITPTVYREVYQYPHKKRIYAWSSTLINEYIGRKLKIRTLSSREQNEVDSLDRVLNSVFYTSWGPVKILHRGELEAVVVAADMDKIVAVDERTMRLVIEDVEMLRQRLSTKLRSWVKVDKKRLETARELIRDILVVRSVDLVAYAFEKGYFNRFKNPRDALHSSLYALKYGGCAVSEEEIERFLRGV